MVINRKEFTKLAVSMGIAKRSEVKMFFEEFPKEQYDDDKDIICLWRKVQVYRRWTQSQTSSANASVTYKGPIMGGRYR